jgi:hypothetical protein
VRSEAPLTGLATAAAGLPLWDIYARLWERPMAPGKFESLSSLPPLPSAVLPPPAAAVPASVSESAVDGLAADVPVTGALSSAGDADTDGTDGAGDGDEGFSGAAGGADDGAASGGSGGGSGGDVGDSGGSGGGGLSGGLSSAAAVLTPVAGSVVVALYAFAGEDSDELSMAPGQRIRVTGTEYAGWWRGVLLDGPAAGSEGLFPANYAVLAAATSAAGGGAGGLGRGAPST